MSIGAPRILGLLFVLAGVTVSAEAQSLPQRTKSSPPPVVRIEQLAALSTGAFVVKWSVEANRGTTVQSQTVEIVSAADGEFQRSPVVEVLGSAREAVVTIPGFTPEPGDTLKVTAKVVSTFLKFGFSGKQTIQASKSVVLTVIQSLERPEIDVKQ